jgi:nucleotide-binding universal stress UspA family protein
MRGQYRSIVVPLDGSERAEHALPMALSIARRHGAALHVVRVYVPVAGAEGEYAVRYDEALDRELMRRAGEYLQDVVARLARVGGIRATSALREGPVADTIAHHAGTVGADLLVMTTQGRGPLGRFWLGSVSDELARQAGVPILFVRPQKTAPNFGVEPSIRRVLIPLDGSALAESILEPVLALWDSGRTEYTLLQIVQPTAELDYGPAGGSITGFQESLDRLRALEQQELKRAHEYLEPLAARLRARLFAVHTRAAAGERPANGILDDATLHGADLIALATRGRGGLKRLVLGSTADKVLRGADTPVLTYRPAAVS